MWKKILLTNRDKIFSPQRMWKSIEKFTLGCGEKNVEAVREIGLFHISLYYNCCYCLYLRKIYISSILYSRKEIDYALYL